MITYFLSFDARLLPRFQHFAHSAMETALELRLRQLAHRVDELHINLQRVSSKTLSNSRTTSLEDRLRSLEQGPVPDAEPTVATQIFDDLTMQMNIFEKRLDALEKKIEDYHKEFYAFQDYWFNEDEHQIVSTNAETLQAIKLRCDRQAVQIQKIIDTLTTHQLWPPGTSAETSKEPYPYFPKWKSSDTTASSSRKRRTTREEDTRRLHQTGVADVQCSKDTICLL